MTVQVLQNLLELVRFWNFFYGAGQREQDCEALERSSKIPFREWHEVTCTADTSKSVVAPDMSCVSPRRRARRTLPHAGRLAGLGG